MEEKPERKNCNNIRIVATNLIEIDASIQYVVLKLTEKNICDKYAALIFLYNVFKRRESV
jgi:hypothetical protein